MRRKATISAPPRIASVWIPTPLHRALHRSPRRQPGSCCGSRASRHFACYSRRCGGNTEDAAAVWGGLRAPFLRSHADPYCSRQGAGQWHWSAPAAEIAAALQQVATARARGDGRHRYRATHGVGAGASAGAGRQRRAGRVAASSFRFAIGRALGFNTVRSDQWSVVKAGTQLEFAGTGEGHGVGLCQLGADQMGIEGQGYREILAFYYPGTALGLTARGLDWRRIGGETVSLMTTQPGRDGAVLASAERQVKEIAGRYGWTPPVGSRSAYIRMSRLFAMRRASRDGWPRAPPAGESICSRRQSWVSAARSIPPSIMNCCTSSWKRRRRPQSRCGFAKAWWDIWSIR